MVCEPRDSQRYREAQERARKEAVRRLEEQLLNQSAVVSRNALGQIQIDGWQGDRAGLCDDCAAQLLLSLTANPAVTYLVQAAQAPIAQTNF